MTALNQLVEWIEAQEKRGETNRTEHQVAWKAPPEGKIKINVDAGWTGTNSTGFGFVARSHTGALLAAGTLFQEHRLEPLTAEALALRWSMQQASELGMDSVLFESDSLSVIKSLRAESNYWTIQDITLDCLHLADNFLSCSFSHVTRKANVPAHILASLACKYQNRLWWDAPPAEIDHSLFADAAFS
ncbi:uncharacterized protein LOC130713926 [Lotus japonicus]|uniref:uncharacterized protein LOC130713926 n=1 Tax=Lotus japonicus TaxID=34305 RepID=UPI0025831260|nr:uncharacterized protein LOC130713926 [Lotus japonicus]